ncbi:cytochrome C [Salinisphaera sp. T31B1]|uniref:c-type cytochrome n=1 Tax=Salinisphaera sp. T31B1 TaxID=727963 RepID=UPI003341F261
MTYKRQTVATVLLALAIAPWGSAVFAADDGPIVNDYSKMGADYNAPSDTQSSAGSEKSGDSAAAKSDSSGSSNSSASSQTASSGGEDGKPYKVDCDGSGPCKVSEDVMVGYEKFGGHCSQCHAQNAEGSTFAPSLVDRLKGMDQGRFTAAVAGGVTTMDSTTGMYRVMPAWSENEDVMNHVQQIWAFLKARSDGALPAGRPQPMQDKG